MNLKSNFTGQKPREKAGATASSRFEYQKNVSMSLLLEHEDQLLNDYLFIFDFHEDLVIMDAEADPRQVSFYQIKGKKTGTWTLRTLSKTELDAAQQPLLSTLGKLYDCRERFIEQTQALNFLSNARYKLGMADKSGSETKDTIIGIELCEKDQAALKTNLKTQLSLKSDPELDKMHFKVLNISLTDSERHLKGILVDFFKRKFDITPDVDVIYKSFLNEITKRTNYQKDIDSYDELLKYKAIPKSAFSSWIAHIVHSERSLKDKWQELFTLLSRENVSFQRIKQLKEGWTTYTLLAKDPNSQYVGMVIRLVQKSKDELNGITPLFLQMEQVYERIKTQLPAGLDNVSVTHAIILDQLY
jgi:hypothetical protein